MDYGALIKTGNTLKGVSISKVLFLLHKDTESMCTCVPG